MAFLPRIAGLGFYPVDMPWPTFLNSSFLLFGTIESTLVLLFAITILFSPKNAIFQRFASLLWLSILTYSAEKSFYQICENPHWRGAISPLLWIQLMSASELLLISRASLADINTNLFNKEEPKVEKTMAAQIIQVTALLWNLRRIGTKWQAKNVPASSSSIRRFDFVLSRLGKTLLAYTLLDILASGPSPDLALVSPEKETLFRLGALSLEDWIFRIVGTASFWFGAGLVNYIIANSVATFYVLVGWSSPMDCPPLYGSFRDAYSIREFWGNTWHQCLRKGLSGHADAISDDIFRLPRGNLISRYTRLFLAYFISGLIHHSSDIAMSIPSAEAGALTVFILSALGIMLEDGVQALAKDVPIFAGRPRVRKIIGYLWVMVFWVWSTPLWLYPRQRQDLNTGDMLPIRIVGPLSRQFQDLMQ